MRRIAGVVAALAVAVTAAGCGGLSDNEKKFVAGVQSQTHTTMSEDALVQAGHDSCDGKQDASGSLQTVIALEAVVYLCKH